MQEQIDKRNLNMHKENPPEAFPAGFLYEVRT